MSEIVKMGLFYTLLFLAVAVVGLGIAYTKSYFEAAAYERVTGKQVSTWDAMFLQLRVDGCER